MSGELVADLVRRLVERLGGRWSRGLGIDVDESDEEAAGRSPRPYSGQHFRGGRRADVPRPRAGRRRDDRRRRRTELGRAGRAPRPRRSRPLRLPHRQPAAGARSGGRGRARRPRRLAQGSPPGPGGAQGGARRVARLWGTMTRPRLPARATRALAGRRAAGGRPRSGGRGAPRPALPGRPHGAPRPPPAARRRRRARRPRPRGCAHPPQARARAEAWLSRAGRPARSFSWDATRSLGRY